jgi:vacuolar-type H+-ATPase subunit I/STV1
MELSGKDKPKTLHSVINEMIERVNNNTQRLRILEQGEESIELRVNAVEQNMLGQRRELQKSIDELGSRISNQEKVVSGLENTLKEVITHLKKVATASRVNEIEKMIEIYNPLKSNFITKEEADQLVRKLINK